MKLKAAEKSNKKLYVMIIKSLKKTLKMNKCVGSFLMMQVAQDYFEACHYPTPFEDWIAFSIGSSVYCNIHVDQIHDFALCFLCSFL